MFASGSPLWQKSVKKCVSAVPMPAPRLEAFALPIMVERARKKPHAICRYCLHVAHAHTGRYYIYKASTVAAFPDHD